MKQTFRVNSFAQPFCPTFSALARTNKRVSAEIRAIVYDSNIFSFAIPALF